MSLHIALIGAGPVGLTLALLLARQAPHLRISLFDARSLSAEVSQDPRTLALSLGSVQLWERLGVWQHPAAQPIVRVHVSQQPHALTGWLQQKLGEPEVVLHATQLAVPMLGAVMRYGAILAPLQSAWFKQCAQNPAQWISRFDTHVKDVHSLPNSHVQVHSNITEIFDLAVIAEGGVFSDTTAHPTGLRKSYGQTAWVGTVQLDRSLQGSAYERFTLQGPAALLPLLPDAEGHRGALVWCRKTPHSSGDELALLSDEERLSILNGIFPEEVGRITGISALKPFSLGLQAQGTTTQGCTVRIGNAAQMLHPVAGQGLNLGLRDAFTLASNLRFTKLTTPQQLQRQLRQVQWQRAPDRWTAVAATDFLARAFTWPGMTMNTLRGLGLSTLGRYGPLKQILAQTMMYGWR
jgi:2-octaprenyl-6-methoxyphenol hydroxylase